MTPVEISRGRGIPDRAEPAASAIAHRPRGTPDGPEHTDPRADPQPGARNQESAGRTARCGATARPGTGAAGTARVHAGDHEGGGPPAVADGPAAYAAPAAASHAFQCARGAGTRAQSAAGGISRRNRDPPRLRREPAVTDRRSRADHPGAAEHRTQRRAGHAGARA